VNVRKLLPSRHLLWIGLSIFVTSNPALAHDFLSGTVVASVRDDSVELTVTLLGDTFLELLKDSEAAPQFEFTREKFLSSRSLFADFAAEHLYEVTIDDRRQQPLSADVSLIDDEFILRLSYPRPGSGNLRLSALYLRSAIADFRADVIITNGSDMVLANKVVVRGDSAIEIPLSPL